MEENFKLFLIPVPLGEEADNSWVSPKLQELINRLKILVVENERTARRHLRKMGFFGKFDDLKLLVLDENSGAGRVNEILREITTFGEAGLMSEAGVPGIADPGEDLVWALQLKGATIVPVAGPSSLFLALMASGLNGEKFCFNGYLPVKSEDRKKEIKILEQRAQSGFGAQLFIETPYRSQAMLNDLLTSLSAKMRLCIASNIGMQDESIFTKRIEEWKKKPPAVDRRLCIFIIDA